MSIKAASFIVLLLLLLLNPLMQTEAKNTSTSATLDLTYPDGGEAFIIGKDIIIKWAGSEIQKIKIEYTFNDGTTWKTIAEDVEADSGSYTWKAPYVYSQVCKVKLTSQSDPSITDISNGTFKIIDQTSNIPKYFEARSHSYNSTAIKYRLFIPEDYKPGKKFPLVLTLHGMGERGTDNISQITNNRLATCFADPKNQMNYPCFVVSPQCPPNALWVAQWGGNPATVPITNEMATVYDIVNSLIAEFNIDTTRLYITGLSMGGYATFDLIMRYPDKFAAAVPMSAGADTFGIKKILGVPLWNFHGAADATVNVILSRNIMAAYEHWGKSVVYTHCNKNFNCIGMTREQVQAEINNGAELLYTEYQYGGHAIWQESYDYPLLLPWLFRHGGEITSVENKDKHDVAVNGFQLLGNYPNPFNPTTTISYTLNKTSKVTIKVFDILGREITTLVNAVKEKGTHSINFDGSGLSSGVYFYSINSEGYNSVKKMIMTK